MPRFRRNQVVVITGASTGIGRATALEFAKHGARLVLAARQKDKLDDLGRTCARMGADALAISVDVTNPRAVEELAEQAEAYFGGIDVWVNNAGVGVIGSFTEVPVDEHRRVIETNLLGYVHGTHAALTVFRRQGHGVLINNASISSRIPTPYLASYTASKFGIRGLTQSVRQDLALEGLRDIHVCQINPGVVDTPAFAHAANFSHLPVEIRFPMTTPEKIAEEIFGLAEYPRREIAVGPLTGLGGFAYAVLPALTAAVLTLGMKYYYFSSQKEEPASEGNLFRPVRDLSRLHGRAPEVGAPA